MDNATEFLTDLAAPVKVRKTRAPKHDFQNGEGKVFAHRHSNGGGWVADTAYVAESVKVASGCGVYGCAKVTDNVTLSGKAHIGDHARVMHNVSLSGTALVRGSAIVRDRVNLTEKTFVAGQAHLSGNTFTQGRVYIGDFAVVHNTRCNGPKSSYSIELLGNARVFDSVLNGPVFVGDSAYMQNSHVGFIRCLSSSKIFNSNINTSVDGEISMFAYPGGGRRRRRAAEPNPANVPEIADRLLRIHGLVMNSRIQMRPCIITPQAYLLDCTLHLYHQDTSTLFTEFPAGAVVNLSTSVLTTLVQYYRRDTAQTAAASPIPAIASVGTVPNFDQLRQRRIMRMEETT